MVKYSQQTRGDLMLELNAQQIRNYRLIAHHLDRFYEPKDLIEVVGACGLQNTPPNAWENACYNRIPNLSLDEMHQLLYEEKILLQAWSLRGLPLIFPTAESDVFLSGLKAAENEEWIYTHGIQLALDVLQMYVDELLKLLIQVISQLDHQIILSKNSLDETLAKWMLPYLNDDQKRIWNKPSMYGSPDKQTIGGAVVSFLLRPCAMLGLVVFGERIKGKPTFTSYKNWTGSTLKENVEASKELMRKYLHCYGPATVDSFMKWLGCTTLQGHRLWKLMSEEIEAVSVEGKKAYILKTDKEAIMSAQLPERQYLMLSGHDPYLDQRDREILLPDKAQHPQIWQMVSNPGAVIDKGEIIGVWKSQKKKTGLEIEIKLWKKASKPQLIELVNQYAAFRKQSLLAVNIK